LPLLVMHHLQVADHWTRPSGGVKFFKTLPLDVITPHARGGGDAGGAIRGEVHCQSIVVAVAAWHNVGSSSK